jgi:hypothetical protein
MLQHGHHETKANQEYKFIDEKRSKQCTITNF